ncbi:MAG: BTAD domain-containing putative transcriptional regulator [Anaerolineae bacterium]
MAQLTIRLLGPFRVTLNGAPLEAFNSDKERALLAYLATDGHGPYRREALAGLFWPGGLASSARNSLNQALSTYRRLLRTPGTDGSPPWLVTTAKTVDLVPDEMCQIDVREMDAAAAAGRAHFQPDGRASPACAERYACVADLYTGAFMDGFRLRGCPRFDEWLTARREHYRRQAVVALEALCARDASNGSPQDALRHARRWIGLDPLDERGHRQVMRLLAGLGQAPAALAQYEACRQTLRARLGAEPDRRTTALCERIREGQ